MTKIDAEEIVYLYNKKELKEELGTYDYRWRQYNPLIARWSTPDPLVEKYLNNSMYSYFENNPIAAIDDGGKKVIYVSGYYHPAGNILKGFLPATGGYGYWDYFDPSFVPQSRKLIGATLNESNLFVDGVGEAWSSS